MIADRTGFKPHQKSIHGAGDDRPQSAFCAVGRAYLLLIDRENPLSSMSGRR